MMVDARIMVLGSSPLPAQMELGFEVRQHITPVYGRKDTYQVSFTAVPRLSTDVLSVGDVAEKLSVSPRHASRLLKAGLIPSHQPGLRRRMVYQRDFLAYCAGRGIAV